MFASISGSQSGAATGIVKKQTKVESRDRQGSEAGDVQKIVCLGSRKWTELGAVVSVRDRSEPGIVWKKGTGNRIQDYKSMR